MFKAFLIKYGEIGIKGKNRHLFEDALVRQIRFALEKIEGSFYVHKEQGRIYVDIDGFYDFEETVAALQRVFGIVGICPVMKVEDKGKEELGNDVIEFLSNVYDIREQTFKVDTRRAKKTYPLDSMEMNAYLGGRILDAFPGLSVDVHRPEIMVHVEIREKIYIYSKIIPGPGGMPVGTNGKAMLLLSGGI
ncbi:MAG: THUMP domain-containing protein, partial [Lachnospiraceae bacterium]|nr:THUMP domain-containing protein [Lachnospiraceae bacterium]